MDQQNPSLQQLDQDIWRPFCAAYAAKDIEAYLALHTEDLVRVDVRAGTVSDLAEYGKIMREFFDMLIEHSVNMRIDFRFSERLTAADVASERGVYRLTLTRPGSEDRIKYGAFSTISRRTENGWRLAVDHDCHAEEEEFVNLHA